MTLHLSAPSHAFICLEMCLTQQMLPLSSSISLMVTWMCHTGAGVTVTRTLSLDRNEWDRLLAQPTPALRPMHSTWKLDTESLESSEHRTGPVK